MLFIVWLDEHCYTTIKTDNIRCNMLDEKLVLGPDHEKTFLCSFVLVRSSQHIFQSCRDLCSLMDCWYMVYSIGVFIIRH